MTSSSDLSAHAPHPVDRPEWVFAGQGRHEQAQHERLQPEPSRRERKKQETRAALEQAALRLFAEKGYEQTTVEEIAEAADVAVRTFFRYFSSKQHVLFGDTVVGLLRRMRAELYARPRQEPPLQSVRSVMVLLDPTDPEELHQIELRLRLLEQQPSMKPTYLMLIHDMRRIVVDFVAERTGLSAVEHPYPLMIGSAAASAWDIAVCVWARTHGRIPLGQLEREVFDTLTTAIPHQPPAPETL